MRVSWRIWGTVVALAVLHFLLHLGLHRFPNLFHALLAVGELHVQLLEAAQGLGELNLSHGGAYPIRYALRLAAGFGSQISMMLLRWTPVADGRRRTPEDLGYGYRIADPAAWTADSAPVPLNS